MGTGNRPQVAVVRRGIGLSLAELIREVAQKCTRCGVCQQDCAFLRTYGTPDELAQSYDPSDLTSQSLPFKCSLCRLCAVRCPVKLNPAALFLEMRREKMRRDPLDYPGHAGLLAYEKRGTSRRFTYYAIPEHCDTVFFPGCTLAGTRSETTLKIYEHLKRHIPALGIVLDCCLKISHDLGREEYFHAMFGEMRDFLIKSGVKKVMVACPNCHRIFHAYGGGLTAGTIYEVLDEHPLPAEEKVPGRVVVHDPCPLRFSPDVHAAVRSLIAKQGLTVEEMTHHGVDTYCCGEGGSVAALSPALAEKWREGQRKEAAGRMVITYCAGCTNRLDGTIPASHVVDLLCEPEATMAGKVRTAKAPFTYLNRLKLKRQLKQRISAPVTRERDFGGNGMESQNEKNKNTVKRILLIGAIVAAILAVRLTGAVRYLDQEALRQWIAGYGGLAPVAYIVIYALAPSLLLPGLPITIAGGILFGPFWGVVYAITGATIGACIAFLVARYLARDWVKGKLKSPQWRRLDHGVEKQGWKVVAFTRLIPLFPFNLLNYAFGLTGIKFLHYAVATFFCMLPACIAFIVFSSSLLDVLKGKVSIAFVAGLGLVILVSLIPLFYQRYKKKKGINDPL